MAILLNLLLNIYDKLDKDNNPFNNYNLLDESITTATDTFLPVKIIKYNKHKHKQSRWITQGIIRSIKFRDKLYSRIKQTSIHAAEYVTLKTNIHTYNAILIRNIRLAKQMYYQSSFERNKYDIKKTWCMIKEIIKKTPKKEHFPDYFKVDGKIVTDKNTIANKCN